MVPAPQNVPMDAPSGYPLALADNSDFFSNFLALNPFPQEDPLHGKFVRMASESAALHARIAANTYARLEKASTEQDYLSLRLDSVGWMYDLYGHMYAMAACYENLQEQTEALRTMADFYVGLGMRRPGNLDPEMLRMELHARLEQRKFHWTAQCHEVARVRATLHESEPQPQTSLPSPIKDAESVDPMGVGVDPDSGSPPSTIGGKNEPRGLVDAYLREASECLGRRVTRKEFWRAAGYQSSTEFERWQRGDPRTTVAARTAFERTLRDRPHMK